jgi:pyruvate kinase
VLRNPKTKIVATVGPASSSPAMLEQLIDAGVSVFRLNFSHGTHDDHSAVVGHLRSISRRRGRHVAILQDLCGPKIRLGPIPGDVVDCQLGEEFSLVAGASSERPHELTCSYEQITNDLKTGETVLFADGTVAMVVVDAVPGRVRMKVTLAGRLRSRQGLNLPGTELAVPSLTPKDFVDLDWTARHADDVDFVGLSFVRTAADVLHLREALRSRRCPAHVVVKIEKPQAVAHLDEIVAAADGVMVARGDLGVEMNMPQVPAIQKRIIAVCNRAERPVITATQMLNSMEHSNRPTRAEATDVFNAVIDGTDAVMLSGESAVGEYPVESVKTMAEICREAEAYLKSQPHRSRGDAAPRGLVDDVTAASVDAACEMTERLDAALIVVASETGRTAVAISNRRPSATILALMRTEAVARSLSLCWGVTATLLPESSSVERVLEYGVDWARANDLAKTGQHAVLLRGHVVDRPSIRAILAGIIP